MTLKKIQLNEITWDNQTIRFRKTLSLTPKPTKSGKYLTLKKSSLDIDVIAPTRKELIWELQERIIMLWEEYAMEDDAKLTKSAQVLKRNLLEALEVE